MSFPTIFEIIHVIDISYSIKEFELLKNINFSLASNKINSIIGPNGSGKTLTNKILALLLKPSLGKILWDTHTLPLNKTQDQLVEYRRQIGYMAQKPIFLNQKVESNAEIPLILIGYPREARKKIVVDRLKQFELSQHSDLHPLKLSFGQQQKLSLLISMIKDPPLLILDEPTASLDPKNTLWFEAFVKNNYISDERVIVWTTHDVNQMKRTSDQVIFIINGEVIETGPKSILENPKSPSVSKYLEGELMID